MLEKYKKASEYFSKTKINATSVMTISFSSNVFNFLKNSNVKKIYS
jgi:translation initiation factor 2B subunit (eIF-2B alpha/beta/delta family)